MAFIDHNKFQINGAVEDVNGVGDLESRFKSFKWNAITVDGHDVKAIYKAVAFAKAPGGPNSGNTGDDQGIWVQVCSGTAAMPQPENAG